MAFITMFIISIVSVFILINSFNLLYFLLSRQYNKKVDNLVLDCIRNRKVVRKGEHTIEFNGDVEIWIANWYYSYGNIYTRGANRSIEQLRPSLLTVFKLRRFEKKIPNDDKKKELSELNNYLTNLN